MAEGNQPGHHGARPRVVQMNQELGRELEPTLSVFWMLSELVFQMLS